MLKALLLFAASPVFAMHLMIDPGHGGIDSGATRGKVKESQIVLDVSKILKKFFDQDPSFKASLSRSSDKSLSLSDRSRLAHKMQVDLFLSIHANSSPIPSSRGTEFYFENQLPPDEESMYLAMKENASGEEEGKFFRPPLYAKKHSGNLGHILDDMAKSQYIRESAKIAKYLEKSFRKNFRRKALRIRQAPFHVISTVNMPSLLIELGYLSHPKEVLWMQDPKYQRKLARSIYQGIQAYKSSLDKAQARY